MGVSWLGRITNISRIAGLIVVFVCAFGLLSARDAAAADACTEYTMAACISEGTCFELAGNECGGQIGPQCAGLGWVACGYSNCPQDSVTMICDFED